MKELTVIGFVRDMYKEGYSFEQIREMQRDCSKAFGHKINSETYSRAIRKVIAQKDAIKIVQESIEENDYDDIDEEIKHSTIIQSNRLRQKSLDVTREVRKENRETYRLTNVIEASYKKMTEALEEVDLTKFKFKKPVKYECKTMIVHCSDWHGNEFVDAIDGAGYYYDFEVLAKRAEKYANRIRKTAQDNKVEKLVVINTGDMVNSSRRLSEKLNSCTAQTRATLLVIYIIEQMLLDLARDFEIEYHSVGGNESRIGEEKSYDSTDVVCVESYDYLVFHGLRKIFQNTPIKFIGGDFREKVIEANKQNFLILHGDTLPKGDFEKATKEILSTYALRGIKLSGIFIGHIHSCVIGDFISRCSSMVGSNGYSTKTLHLSSRASQNLYLINDVGYDGIKIDLQDIESFTGYDIIKELEFYNVPKKQFTNRVIIENLV